MGSAGRGPEAPRLVDDLANVARSGYPAATATYTFALDSPARAVDGQDLHIDTPSSRWTNYGSPNPTDRLAVDLGAAVPVSDIRISFYDDGGGVRTPDAYTLDYRTGDGRWLELPGQRRTPAVPRRGVLNRILLDAPVTTDGLRLTPVRDGGGGVGVSAWQAWRAEDPRLGVAVLTGEDGTVAVAPGQPVEVTTTVTTTAAVTVRPELLAPRGWSVAERRTAGTRHVRAGAVLRTRWTVTAPTGLPGDAVEPLRLLVHSRLDDGTPRTTGDIVPTRVE
ncbi:discoidin domain-containing protein [Streptomyces genisteinicus]|uniref:discoidin domain-containing protein n=1 Tax=Streptomyces genisteinicus TaxID=2768068 RepID=UPI003CCD9114